MDTYKSILETIGNTPIVELDRSIPRKKLKHPHRFFAKLEYFNPGTSVKDRIAISIIEKAEERGEIKPGGTIIEATSGNTGLGLAMVAAVKGYKAIFVMPDKISEEKRAALRAFGAKVIITPTAVEPDDPRSYYSVAQKLVEITPGAFYANQYNNPDNPQMHYETTGPEIWKQMGDELDVFVAGAGTGGTISGIGKYLKEQKSDVKVVCPDPVGSILYDLFYYKEIKNPPMPYKVEGVGEDILPENVHMNVIDDFVQVNDQEAFTKCRELVLKDGLCVGPSSALALMGAIKYAEKLDKPSNILVIFPDHGKSYMSKAFNDAWMKENGFLPSPLHTKTIADLLTSKPAITLVSAKVGDSVESVVELLKEKRFSQVPVFSDDELVGLIDEGDLMAALAKGQVKMGDPIIHLVSGNILWANMNDSLMDLVEHFQKGYVALVKDQKERMRIITKIDLLDYLEEYL